MPVEACDVGGAQMGPDGWMIGPQRERDPGRPFWDPAAAQMGPLSNLAPAARCHAAPRFRAPGRRSPLPFLDDPAVLCTVNKPTGLWGVEYVRVQAKRRGTPTRNPKTQHRT
ncbi:hypothetical protein SKAU_G00425110 [Synaphobranchus kaupii]|uniref:Uncharacterized protein n=1 Tax=Synaphobranchus kaupii TaxID=118154 RepID=A0A9Q1E5S7_SYNKA|nr:hypothetical protein SKAU_G00425110 [Synaphobranchus kaupii]